MSDAQVKVKIAAPERCPICGGSIVPLAKPHRLQWTNAHGYIPVPDDLVVPTCLGCDAEWMDGSTATALDAAAEAWNPPPGWTKIRKHTPGCRAVRCSCGCTPPDASDEPCDCWLEGGPEETWPRPAPLSGGV